MIIGVPKEIKTDEQRVGLTPAGCSTLTASGHRVLVQREAGAGSGFQDAEYQELGAELVDQQDIWQRSELIVKVKEPLAQEYDFLRAGQMLFTFLHLAADRGLTEVLLNKQVVAIAYETIKSADGSLPLLLPMSEIAGRMAVQVGAQLLQQTAGGRGILLGGAPGVPPAEVVVVGAGTVGSNAVRIAVGLGAQVTVIDLSPQRLRQLEALYPGRIVTMISNGYNLTRAVSYADLLIGAVLVPGAKAPKVISEEMVQTMKPGSVIIDVAIDQGGCVATIDRPTAHSQPVYLKYGVLHYAVANIPGAVPRTSTFALTNVTLPYIVALANQGYYQAALDDPALKQGVNLALGKVTHQAIAATWGMEYSPLEKE